MKIIDESTQKEITNPDLTAGILTATSMWASPEAYATVDNVTKFALDPSDFEEVQIYHRWTDEELEAQASVRAKEDAEADEQMRKDLTDATLAELFELTATQAATIAEQDEVLAAMFEGSL
jgi:hypothetical protein